MKYIIFIKNDCPYCVDAASLLESKGLNYSSVVFRKDQEDILKEVKNAFEWQTVPIIVERNEGHTKLIGGYTDLVEYLKDE